MDITKKLFWTGLWSDEIFLRPNELLLLKYMLQYPNNSNGYQTEKEIWDKAKKIKSSRNNFWKTAQRLKTWGLIEVDKEKINKWRVKQDLEVYEAIRKIFYHKRIKVDMTQYCDDVVLKNKSKTKKHMKNKDISLFYFLTTERKMTQRRLAAIETELKAVEERLKINS